jgi:DnaJ like chaperone protein
MGILGKVFGFVFGFMFGKWFGALIGLWLGHKFDKAMGQNFNLSLFKSPGAQQQFFFTTFAVMGHVAKANGVVTTEEIRVANQLMDQMGLKGDQRLAAQEAFRDGKRADFPLDDELDQFVRLVKGRRDVLRIFLELQLQGAFADGIVDAKERAILDRIATKLNFSSRELNQLIARWEAEFRFHQKRQQRSSAGARPSSRDQLKDAYQLLGVKESDSDQDIKRSYRRLMIQHHPDKLVSKGLPPEMLEVAKQKAQDIQQAYELVKTTRGMR